MSQGSSPDEFERLCRQNYPRLTAQLHALTNDPVLARRLAGAAFGQARQNWRTVRALPEPTAWVRARAMRRLTGFMRRRNPGAPDLSLDPVSRRLLDELARLPIVQRRALVLAHMARLSTGRLAAEVGTSSQAIELLLAHARLALTHRLTRDDPANARVDRWSPGRREDWLTRRMAVLENRLAPRGETLDLLLTLRNRQRRRQVVSTVAAGAVLLGALGAAIGMAVAHGDHRPVAHRPDQPPPATPAPAISVAPLDPAVPDPPARPTPSLSLLTPTGTDPADAPGLMLYDDDEQFEPDRPDRDHDERPDRDQRPDRDEPDRDRRAHPRHSGHNHAGSRGTARNGRTRGEAGPPAAGEGRFPGRLAEGRPAR